MTRLVTRKGRVPETRMGKETDLEVKVKDRIGRGGLIPCINSGE